MSVIQIESNEQFTKLTETPFPANNKLIVLYFYTKWAEPCKSTNELVSALSHEFRNENASFLAVDADINNEIVELFDVSIVPYFIFIQNGRVLEELSGDDPKKFVQILDQYLCISSTLFLNAQQGDNVNNHHHFHNSDSEDSVVSQYTAESEYTDEEINGQNEEKFDKKLSKLVQAAPVMVFLKGSPSEPKCGYSRQMVKILRENKIRFGFFDILRDDNVRKNMKRFSDWPTFPQLYINGEFQGGLDIVKETLEDDPEYFNHALNIKSTPKAKNL